MILSVVREVMKVVVVVVVLVIPSGRCCGTGEVIGRG